MIVNYGIEQKDILFRKGAWDSFWQLYDQQRSEQADYIKRLLPFIESKDIVQRRAAAETMSKLQIVQLDALFWDARIPEPYTPSNLLQPVESGGAPLAESPEERVAIDKIAAFARKWLQEYEK